jgi:hypothetical protein
MNKGVPPTAAKARTGELTPPGISRFAFRKRLSELAVRRAAEGLSGMKKSGESDHLIALIPKDNRLAILAALHLGLS